MGRALVLIAAMVAGACSSEGGTNPDPVLSVGGTYRTAVTMVQNTCPGQTVQQFSTVVNHEPGSTSLSLTHAGSTYNGTIDPDATFATTQVTQVFDGITYAISISGRFSLTDMDAQVHVAASRQPPCTFTARWAGPKDGDPNVIP